MAPELFLRRIKEEFPEIAWNTYRHLTHGWDHAVLILDEALVFRAPKAPTSPSEVENEAGLLRHLERKLKVGIPRYIYQAADGSFGGYRLLPGRELDPGTFRKLSAEERETIAEQLAAFLTSMHETPKSVARRHQVPEEDAAKDYEDLVRDTEALVFPHLARRDTLAIEAFLTGLAAELEQGRPTGLLHGDLSGEHILWDAGKRQVNIIDFSDRMLGDPAIDSPVCWPTGGGSLNAYSRSTVGRRTSGCSRGPGCASSGTRSRRWCIRSRAIRALSRKATRSLRRGSTDERRQGGDPIAFAASQQTPPLLPP